MYCRDTGQGTPAAKGCLGRVSWRKYQHRAAKNSPGVAQRAQQGGESARRGEGATGREPRAQDLQVTGGPCSSPRIRARETEKMCHFLGVWFLSVNDDIH